MKQFSKSLLALSLLSATGMAVALEVGQSERVQAETIHDTDGFTIEAGTRIRIHENQVNFGGTATATIYPPHGNAQYDINVRVLAENDGQSTLKLFVNNVYIATRTYPLGTNWTTLTFPDVNIAHGAIVRIEAKINKGAFARIDYVDFLKIAELGAPVINPGAPKPVASSAEAEHLTLDGYAVENVTSIKVTSPAYEGIGKASFTYTGDAGERHIHVRAMGEDDGRSAVGIAINGQSRGFWSVPIMNGWTTLRFDPQYLLPGDVVTLTGVKGGYASFARLDKVSLLKPAEFGGRTSTSNEKTFEAERMALSGYAIDKTDSQKVKVSGAAANSSGSVTFTPNMGLPATYDIQAFVLGESDGKSTFKLYINGVLKGSRTPWHSSGYASMSWGVFHLNNNDVIKIVGQRDGTATSAHIDKVRIR